MHRTRLAVLALLSCLVVAAGGCTALKRCAYEGFDRDDWQQPERVVETLGLAPGDRVADLGAGSGYFTFRLAEAVGPEGRVYAVDVDEALLDEIREEAAERGLDQVETLRAEERDPKLAPESVDLVFVSNTYHHLPEPSSYFARLRDRLREGGRIAIVELHEGGFPPGHGADPETLRAALRAAGYERVARHDFLERQSFQVFTPVPTSRAEEAAPAAP